MGGLVGIGLGQFWLAHISTGGVYWESVLPGLLLTAFGMGLAFPTASVGATGGVAKGDQGLAAGLLNTSQQVGSAIGLAVLAAIAAGTTADAHGSLSSGYRVAYLVATGIAALAVVLVATQHRAGECQEEAARQRGVLVARQC